MKCPVCEGEGSWWEDYAPREFGRLAGEEPYMVMWTDEMHTPGIESSPKEEPRA